MTPVKQESGDVRQLVPMAEEFMRELGELPAKPIAGAGNFTEVSLRALEARHPSDYFPPYPSRVVAMNRCPIGWSRFGEGLPQRFRSKEQAGGVSLAESQSRASLWADVTGPRPAAVPSPRKSSVGAKWKLMRLTYNIRVLHVARLA
jgi:hypothetical protein